MCHPSPVRCLVILSVLAAGAIGVSSQAAAQPLNREYLLKASFLGIFGDLVEWPGSPGLGRAATLTIGVLGEDPFSQLQADGRRVNHLDQKVAEYNGKGRKITVQRFGSTNEYRQCHILFISGEIANDADELQAALRKANGVPVLLVGDTPGLAQQGIVLNLVFEPAVNRVRLEINPDAANRAGLKIDRRLYGLPGVRIIREANS
jgi:hypothetical protein